MGSLSSAVARLGLVMAPAWALGCGNASPSADAGPQGAGPQGPISFRNDLELVHGTDTRFAFTCGLSGSCHNAPVHNPKTDRVFLGCNPMNMSCTVIGDIAEQVYQKLVGNPDAGMSVMSQELPTMAFVQPHDPDHSYLVRKLEGTLSDLQSQCEAVSMDPIVASAPGESPPLQPCGLQMPLNANVDPAFNAKVRAWIMQGAPDN
jgi:hypothetical protein